MLASNEAQEANTEMSGISPPQDESFDPPAADFDAAEQPSDKPSNEVRPAFMWPPPPPSGYEKPPAWIGMINKATESCPFKAALSGTAGGSMGLLFGLFFGGYSNAVDKAVEMEGPATVKLRVGFREAAKSMRSYAKSFAMFGVVFSASECTVEKVRAKHDIYNSMIAGCMTGAIVASSPRQPIGAQARATQMAVGCAGMAAFSTAIDYYMEYMD